MNDPRIELAAVHGGPPPHRGPCQVSALVRVTWALDDVPPDVAEWLECQAEMLAFGADDPTVTVESSEVELL